MAAARAHVKDPAHRTKVVLRRLPPAIAQQVVADQVDARFASRYDWSCFRPGNASQKNHRYSRLYLNFKSPEDVVEFAEVFNGHVFVNEKGAQFKALVEYAPSQQVPKSNAKKDARQGTIIKDPEYLEFLESISKPAEHLPSAEIQLERKEAERAAAGKDPPVVTPLMAYIRQQRAAKSMAQRSGNSRLSRKVAGVVTSSPSPSKRGSEKRRTSGSAYVLRDNAKEKPTYILVPKRDEHGQREKNISGTPDATSGGTSGSGQVAEIKKEKIVLLKGRARVDSNTSDVTTQQHSGTSMKSAAQSSSRQDQRIESSGRIIKTILSNKEGRHVVPPQHDQEGHIITAEKRPPRIPNPRSAVKDQVENAEKNHFDDKHSHLHGSGPTVEKTERHARNRDRPDRGVWAPRRYDKSASGGTHSSSSEFSPLQQHSEDNFGQQTDGHRHANRRGPPRGLKEMEISASTSDGKPSKRASANYGAHEILKQILQVVEKFWILHLDPVKYVSKMPLIICFHEVQSQICQSKSQP
uniref:UPF3 domain-containing protein n=1 Tax=Leersia perrieri TaxID=77586 RepID=A0A0D9W5A4_9ORYZ